MAWEPRTAQVLGNAVRDGMGWMCEFITGWRLDPAKPRMGSMGAEYLRILEKMALICTILLQPAALQVRIKFLCDVGR